MKRILSVILAFVLILILFGGCGTNGSGEEEKSQVRVWKFAHAGITGDSLDNYALKFKELVEEEFEDVTVELYPNNQLGNEDERFELAISGGTEFAMSLALYVGNILPEAQVFNIGFIMPDNEEALTKIFREGKAISRLNEKIRSLGVEPMDYYVEDFGVYTSNKRIETLEDFKGQKIRAMTAPIAIANTEAMGANPVPIAYSEVYTALQLGTVDGQSNPIDIVRSAKFYEVQKYVALTNHDINVDMVVANKAFFDGLTENEQERLKSLFIELSDYCKSEKIALREAAIKEIEASGNTEIIETTPENRAEMEAVVLPYSSKVFIEEVGDFGQEILDLLLEDKETYSR